MRFLILLIFAVFAVFSVEGDTTKYKYKKVAIQRPETDVQQSN